MSSGWPLPTELEREMTPAVQAFDETLFARIVELEDIQTIMEQKTTADSNVLITIRTAFT